MRQPQKFLFSLPAADLAEIVKRSEKDLLELRGGRLFVTGGTGFFGKWLVGALIYASKEMDLDLRLTILSRDPASFVEKYPEISHEAGIDFQRGDITDFPVTGAEYDFILHGAADTIAIAGAAQEERRGQAIVEGTRRVLALARNSDTRRLLNISSGAVYGATAGRQGGAAEDDYETATPLTAYARAKREAESLCAESQLDFVTARAFAFLGPHLALDAHYAAGNFLRDAQSGGPIRVRSDGTALRSYLYPSDLVAWLLRLLIRGQSGRAYNVGSDEATSTGDLAGRIAAAAPHRPEVIVQSSEPPGSQNIYLPNIARARSELDLAVEVNLEEAIHRTLVWLDATAH
jgi:nucleoside-diphosphate-sugar epimerase